jgi:NAD(P)-dependent dehydrogenase (short-subunit alcohol dehydrogenase family)
MQRFDGKVAVVTGGGTGMGRELVRQLAAEGCHVAMCDVFEDTMEQSQALALEGAPDGTQVTTFVADVSDESQVLAFRKSVAETISSGHINLLFNNAGIAGGGSMVADEREDWDKTFGVCWNGVYFCTRAFLPMLLASKEGHVINTSSVNGFWASLGPQSAHTAYSAAKFAVKGFTEALIGDFRNNAPHLKASVVMPGHIGTSIALNSARAMGREPKEMTSEQLEVARDRMTRMGLPSEGVTDDEIRHGLQQMAEQFRDNAPVTAAQAATIILDGVRKEQWRILIGEDAKILDRLVREAPEEAYEAEFMEKLRREADWQLGT